MRLKRIITALIGFPIVAGLLVFGNKYVIDVVFAIVAGISFYEYSKTLKLKENPVSWIGYVACAIMAFIHIIPIEYLVPVIGLLIPITILILFLHVIITNMKINFSDISFIFMGICYIVAFMVFLPILMGTEDGKKMIWYVLISAWGTDTAAYFVGCQFGKHKFSQISPKKSIEGCVGGIVGAVILAVGYTAILNIFYGMSINYFAIMGIVAILSIIGQIGDFSASAIKRYAGIKDFSNLFPGHGGMLDRIDSVIFIAPFAYFLLMLI